MHTRRFALIAGIVFFVLGVMSFIPAFLTFPQGMPPLVFNRGYSLFLERFPMNNLNKTALIIFGVAGVLAATAYGRSVHMSRLYARLVFVAMGFLALFGMIPVTSTLFGYWPLYGNEAAFHGIASLFGAYFGFALDAKAARRHRAAVAHT